MGNASSAEFISTALEWRDVPLPADPQTRALFLARLLSTSVEVSAEDLFATLQPRDVRACLRRNPANVAIALVEATRILYRFVEEGLRSAQAPAPGGVVQALNTVRFLTRLMPVLLEDSVRPEFVTELFWNNRMPVVTPPPAVEQAPEGAAPPAGAGAAADAAAAPAPAPEPAAVPAAAGPVEVTWLPMTPEDASFLEGRQLGTVLVEAVAGCLFTPGFTISKEQWQVYQLKIKSFAAASASGVNAAAQPSQDAGAPAASGGAALPAVDDAAALAAVVPSLSNAVWPMLMWSGGIFFSAVEPPADPKALPIRVEVLRLLIALCSGALFKAGDATSPSRSPFADVLVGGECPFIPTLFYSLLNTITSYDPVGWAVPYAGAVWSDPHDAIVDVAAQALLVLLDYSPLITVAPEAEEEGEEAAEQQQQPAVFTQFNLCRSLLAGMSDPREFTALYAALTRLLNSVPQADAAMLPGSVYSARCVPELLVLVWKLIDENPAFLRHVVTRCDITALVGPVAYLMWNGRKNLSQVGLVHMCTFMLLLLSGDRAFGVALNKACPRKALPLDCPAPDAAWTYADFLIVTLHTCMIDALPKFSTLFGCWLTIIANISSYTKALSPTAAARLMMFFELFTSPRFLLAGPNNHNFTQQVVEALNNVVQYQFESNAALVHAVVLRREAVERFIAMDWEAATAAVGGAGSGQGGAAAASTEPAGEAAASGATEEAVAPAEPTVELGEAAPSTRAGPEVEGAPAPAAAPAVAPPAAAPVAAPAAWAPTPEWYYGMRASIPMLTLARLIEYLAPLVQEQAAALGVGEADAALRDFIRGTTVVGVLPVPHAIIMRRYTPNIYTALWFTTFIWSTVYLHATQALPLFDAQAIKLFAITLAA